MTTEREQSLWIDGLPLDARSKIAWYVSSGKQNRDMLNLGMATVYQKEAVVEALSYTYSTDRDTAQDSAQWTHIFKHGIRILIANYQQTTGGVSGGHYYTLTSLFSAPTLQELRFHASDRLIGPFLGLHPLRKAVVIFKRESPAWPAAEIALAVKTEDLSIICTTDGRCSLFRLGLLAAHYRLFKSIRLQCMCRDSGLWFLLRLIPKVDEICFAAKPPTTLYERIKQIQNVRLVFNRNAWDLIPRFPENITEIGPHVMSVVDQGSILEQCIRLNKFDCALKSGADITFKYITKTFCSLSVLKLSWARDLNCLLRDPQGANSIDEARYAASGAILNLIKHTPNLAELELKQILVELDEQVEILKLLGDRLRKFSCTIKYDGEDGFRYLGAVIKALRQYNPRVTASNARALVFTKTVPFVSVAM